MLGHVGHQLGHVNIRSDVSPSCLISPFTHSLTSRSSAAPNSSAVTIQGPIGLNVSNDLARLHCPSLICVSRADTSLTMV